MAGHVEEKNRGLLGHKGEGKTREPAVFCGGFDLH